MTQLLRSYRIAHSRIDPFERALRENTPLSSIKDPAAFVEFLNQTNQKTSLMAEQLKILSVQNDALNQKSETSEKELAALKDEISVLKTAQADKDVTKPDDSKGDEGEDMFSYDDEIRKVDAELGSTDEQMIRLTSEINALKEELAVAKKSPEPDTRDAEIKSLKDLLDQRLNQLADWETRAEKERSVHASTLEEKKTQIENLEVLNKKYSTERDDLSTKLGRMSKSTTSLSAEIEGYKKKVAELESRLKATETLTPLSKKNMRKKAKAIETPLTSPLESPQTEALKAEVSKLKAEIAEKDSRIDQLAKQRKTEEGLREEIETLEESIAAMGHDNIEAKNKLKEAENDSAALKSLISKLEKELESSSVEIETLKSNAVALEKISQDRFKELTTLKEVIAKAQVELKSLRQDSADLKVAREELASKENEIRALGKREKELKNETARLKRQSSDYVSEIKSLKDQVSTVNARGVTWADEKRKLQRDNQRLEREKAESMSESKKTSHELETVRAELSSLQPKVKQLEEEVAQLQKEKNLANEAVDLKTQQYDNAQKLIASMRDEALEVSTQIKEAKSQVASLEEERDEVQRHLTERTREAETMRRMLADAREQADAKVRDMRSRMETAIEDRDQFEDKYSSLARNRSREVEVFKIQVHELESQVERCRNGKDEFETRLKESRQRWEELERNEENAIAEAQEMRSAVLNLRSALDASEQQARNMEKQMADLRKLLEESQSRYERANKELQGMRSQLSGADVAYLKNIFLQFLGAKEDKTRVHLIPVLKSLLGFTENEQQQALQYLQRLK
ncbi:hypothetical protein O1611_g3166 [Lasiodiplodia mahajangana]|uniref:Uncharacterized protein n=1 Tax=Lasiodiplodia mahajangana TaxID=1108764 RepID=A0ACC2JSJ1_9PEZI|nr:hypothetical protein O1611_g3166 [Lasiodiplodia mahajangana]